MKDSVKKILENIPQEIKDKAKEYADNVFQEKDYVKELVDKYKDIPTKVKYAFIFEDYKQIFGGKREAESRMAYLYEESDTFIYDFDNALAWLSKRRAKNTMKRAWGDMAYWKYIKLVENGWDVKKYPYFTGSWRNDSEQFISDFISREEKKEYVKLILE